MPLFTVLPSHRAPAATPALLAALTTRCAAALGKSEAVMMVRAEAPALALFGGDDAPSCAVIVRTGGPPSRDQREACLQEVTALVEEHLGVPGSRCFVVFEPVARDHWAVRGALLA